SWEDQKKIGIWEDAFTAEGVDVAKYLGTIPVSARLPWDHIDVGLEEGFLLREYRKALKDRLSLPCGKVAGAFVHATNLKEASEEDRKLVCYDCGIACDLGAMREQRLVMLRKLGAHEPRPAAPPSPRAKGPPPKIEQGDARRYRFLYEKRGAAAFLSHLDVIRALPRSFRRLDIPLWYSQGFHPKPEMVFGPALSLGVASLAEVVDMKIAADIDAPALLEALSEGGTHQGLRFIGAVKLALGDAAVSRFVDTARYVVGIPRGVVDARGGEAWLRGRVAAALEAASLVVMRRIDGVGKRVDVREYLRSLEVAGADGRELLARAGIAGDLLVLSAEVEVRGSGGVKIGEVVEVVVGDAELPHRSVRVGLGARRPDGSLVSPLDLDALRALREDARAVVEPVAAAP
ncbi:MAG TPA: TIGR03936 family radical SAM-associated protein, partial [Solirubrobacteraceae bacterium]